MQKVQAELADDSAEIDATGEALRFPESQLRQLANWGGDSQLSAAEALMWRMETLPQGSSAGTSLHFLASTPSWEDVCDFVDGLSKAVPRLRQCVHELGVGQLPVWRDDQNFQVGEHLRRLSLPQNSGNDVLISALSDFANTPTEIQRPPWEVLFVDGLAGNKSVFALKIQHCLTDGGGLIQLFSAALSERSDCQLRGSAQSLTALAPAARYKRVLMPSPGKMIKSGFKVWQKHRDEGYSLTSAQRYLKSIQSLNAAQASKGSRLLQQRSATNGYDLLNLPLPTLKLLAKAAQASLNDVYLALIIGAFRRYHLAFGVDDEASLPLAFPVSLRKPGDAVGGNQFTGVSYASPLNIADPQERISVIRAFVRGARAEPALDFMNQLLPVAMLLPIKLTAKLVAQYSSRLDVQVSNIPGMARSAYLAGALVESHYVLPPRPGCACMFAMISHQDVAGIALNYDPAAVREPKLLLSCVSDEFAGLCAYFDIEALV
ncbi:hypothetical protein DOK_13057 [gamma proteobacterium BDW918]|nr:hypothetical protein DOK_13057 [gamma proteobacterium BDW918]